MSDENVNDPNEQWMHLMHIIFVVLFIFVSESTHMRSKDMTLVFLSIWNQKMLYWVAS